MWDQSARPVGRASSATEEVGDIAYVHDADIDARTARHTVQQAFHELDRDEKSGPSTGPKMPAGLMTDSSSDPPNDQHAVRAFEANAIDYLLKPYSDERQEAAMARARQRLNERSVFEFGQRMLRLTTRSPQQRRMLDRLVVKSGGTTRFVRVADIDCIEAAGVYVSLHVAGKKLLYRATLQELVTRLDAMRFVRVHRSAVVNIESIVQLEPRSHGEFDVVLRHGSRSRVSRTYRAQLESRLGQPL